MGERKSPILTHTRNNQTGSLSVRSHVFLLLKFQFRPLLEPRLLRSAIWFLFIAYNEIYNYILFVRPLVSRKGSK